MACAGAPFDKQAILFDVSQVPDEHIRTPFFFVRNYCPALSGSEATKKQASARNRMAG
jgi:hypothetical protein